MVDSFIREKHAEIYKKLQPLLSSSWEKASQNDFVKPALEALQVTRKITYYKQMDKELYQNCFEALRRISEIVSTLSSSDRELFEKLQLAFIKNDNGLLFDLYSLPYKPSEYNLELDFLEEKWDKIPETLFLLPLDDLEKTLGFLRRTQKWDIMNLRHSEFFKSQIELRCKTALAANNIHDLIRYMAILIKIDPVFNAHDFFDKYLEHSVEQLSPPWLLKIIEAFALNLATKDYNVWPITKLVKLLPPKIHTLDSSGICSLLDSLKMLRYYHEEVQAKVNERLAGPLFEKVLAQPHKIQYNLLSTLYYLNQTKIAELLIDEIEKRKLFKKASLFQQINFLKTLIKADLERYSEVIVEVSRSIANQRNRFHTLKFKTKNKLIQAIYVLNNLMGKDEKGRIDPRLVQWMNEQDMSSTEIFRYYEDIAQRLLEKLYGETPIRHYNKGVFEYDFYLPKNKLIIEIMGPTHYL